MSFKSVYENDGYQPNQNMTDEQKANPPKSGSDVPNNDPKHQEQIIFNRIYKDLTERSLGVYVDFNSLCNTLAATVSKEICNLAITAKKTDDEIIEKMNKILVAMTKINQRLSALENKQPTYVSPPVYGPVKQFCPRCGHYVDGNHICSGPQTQEIK